MTTQRRYALVATLLLILALPFAPAMASQPKKTKGCSKALITGSDLEAPQSEEPEESEETVDSEIEDSLISDGLDLSNIEAEIKQSPSRRRSNDPTIAYFVSHHRQLSVEEQLELGTFTSEQNPSPEAREKLVLSALPFVPYLTKPFKKYTTSPSQYHDLVLEGIAGLVKASYRYKASKKVQFTTYASYWIMESVYSYLKKNRTLLKLGASKAELRLIWNLLKAVKEYEKQGIDIDFNAIAIQFKAPLEVVHELYAALRKNHVIDFDAPLPSALGDKNGKPLWSFLSSQKRSQEEQLYHGRFQAELKQQFEAFAQTLTDHREIAVFNRRIRPQTEGATTLKEIASAFNLTTEGIRQIEGKVLKKFKKFLTPFYDKYKPQNHNDDSAVD